MANVTVIGAQWGDEGKGKIVDWLASRADVVVRFQGGHNAGHTLVVGNKTYKLSPAALGHRARHAVASSAMASCSIPGRLQDEIAKLAARACRSRPTISRSPTTAR